MKRYFEKRSFGEKMIAYILLHTDSTGHSAELCYWWFVGTTANRSPSTVQTTAYNYNLLIPSGRRPFIYYRRVQDNFGGSQGDSARPEDYRGRGRTSIVNRKRLRTRYITNILYMAYKCNRFDYRYTTWIPPITSVLTPHVRNDVKIRPLYVVTRYWGKNHNWVQGHIC